MVFNILNYYFRKLNIILTLAKKENKESKKNNQNERKWYDQMTKII